MRIFIITIIVLAIITASVINYHTVVSASMEDTLLVGDVFIALKFWYGVRLPLLDREIIPGAEPVPGEILIFRHPIDAKKIYVKRCVATGGQLVEIKAKKLFVDGAEFPLPFEAKHADPEIIPLGPFEKKRDFLPRLIIPDSTIFVLGDNRDFSEDSRIFDPLPKDKIIGKVSFIFLSFDPKVSWSDLKHKIRWERLFKKVK